MSDRNPHLDAPTLARWLDGETSGELADAVAEHLAACPHCQSEVETWRAFGEAVAAPEPTLPPGFVARTCARVTASHAPVAPLWWLVLSRPWRAALATLLLGSAVLGWQLGAAFQPQPDPAEQLASSLAVPELAAIEAGTPSEVHR
ncbi:MAG TPA: anti-sigma factor [Thermoanaerobaculaceae bacterium]|nr:anti-sigma factor [Thermoanaerobaculaceae bacterium]HPS78327.1 anti-sigma factor [Thermoanaerobaculaceae bacterium]